MWSARRSAREADGGIFLHAGPEIGVASTKAFTSQVTALTLLALHLGRMRHLSYRAGKRIIDQLREMPETIARTLQCHEAVEEVAARYFNCNNYLYLGRLYNFPVALEGALKLKEISYVHAEGYPAAEMKHGPIALIEERTPSVFIVPRGGIYPKVMSNLEEIKARRGPVIAIACEGDTRISELADDVIYVPDVEEYLQPLVTSIPLQLLSYHVALLRGCNVDRPAEPGQERDRGVGLLTPRPQSFRVSSRGDKCSYTKRHFSETSAHPNNLKAVP